MHFRAFVACIFIVWCLFTNEIEANEGESEKSEGKWGPPWGPWAPWPPKPSPPNIIIFFIDDLGYGDLGYSGHPTSSTPNIDALAEASKIFTHFYVPSPLCSPSRAALLTGRYQMRSGTYPSVYVPFNTLGLPHNETTIANVLKQEGYKTQIVGKWHLGVGLNDEFQPSNPVYGFDDYLGMPYPQSFCPCPICFPNNGSCLEKCYDYVVSCPFYDNKEILEQPVDLTSTTSKLVSRSLKFMYEAQWEHSPFFLYFPFIQIHRPQYAAPEFYGKSIRGATGDSLLEIDWAIGTIMQTLKQLNQLDNTLVWFTSDNGPPLQNSEIGGGNAGPLRCGKGTTWEGGVRVPTFVHWPTKIPPGKTNALASVMDILPTISSIVGADTKNLTLDGADISPLLFGNTDTSPHEFFAVYSTAPEPEAGPFAIIYNQYKAHFYTKGSDLSDPLNYDTVCSNLSVTTHNPPLLFNIYRDPGERYDLAKREEYSKVLDTILAWREQHMKEITWMEPRSGVSIGVNMRSQPCCTDQSCGPFPTCCDCADQKTDFWKSRYHIDIDD